MQLFRYAGWEPPHRPRTYVVKPKVERPKSSRMRDPSTYFTIPATLQVFTPEQMDQLPSMPMSMKRVMLEVCLKHRIFPNDMVGPNRSKILTQARREFVRRARDELEASFPRIGQAMKRDHSTAVYNYHGKKRSRSQQQSQQNDGKQEVGLHSDFELSI